MSICAGAATSVVSRTPSALRISGGSTESGPTGGVGTLGAVEAVVAPEVDGGDVGVADVGGPVVEALALVVSSDDVSTVMFPPVTSTTWLRRHHRTAATTTARYTTTPAARGRRI